MDTIFGVLAIGLASVLPAWSAGAATTTTLTTIYDFGDAQDANPYCLAKGPSGSLLGSTGNYDYGQLSFAFRLVPPASGQGTWIYQTLASVGLFEGCAVSIAGGIYGTSARGGPEQYASPAGVAPADYYPGFGDFFQLTPPASGQTAWTYRELYDFGLTKNDGVSPADGLVVGQDGALYGSTGGGGTVGHGTIFRLTRSSSSKTGWRETNIFSFLAADGYQPGKLISGPGGVFYGFTASTIFEVTPPPPPQLHGSLRVLYRLSGGHVPVRTHPLLLGRSGELYGTTRGGGKYGFGVLFRLTPPAAGATSWTFADLFDFPATKGGYAGYGSYSADYLARDGSVYGAAPFDGEVAGCNDPGDYPGTPPDANCGVVFRVTPPAGGQAPWTFAVVRQFHGADGSAPTDLVPVSDDGSKVAFYGDAQAGGAHHKGLVYKLVVTP